MNTCKIGNITIGEGITKVCIPIVEKTKDSILECAEKIRLEKADIVELRADYYEDILDLKKTEDMLRDLKKTLGNIPILFTFRTLREGGIRNIELDKYLNLNETIIKSKIIDAMDIEISVGEDKVKKLVDIAHKNKIKIVGSKHNFKETPSKEDIINDLIKIQELEVDIPKIAVMPNNKKDVLNLISATEEVTRKYADRPVITISMGKEGIISRFCGEFFGSALSFAALEKSSAPGQISVSELKEILSIIHRNI